PRTPGPPPTPTLFPYTTLFRSRNLVSDQMIHVLGRPQVVLRARQERTHTDVHHEPALDPVHYLSRQRLLGLVRRVDLLPHPAAQDRKSTRLNSSHEWISYAVFC